ncbi:MAG: DinB family protein [Tepidisphaeraceae bacterium]
MNPVPTLVTESADRLGREKWPGRKFVFEIPSSRLPYILERLGGTAARIDEKVRGVGAADLTRRVGRTWSAQENIGHLIDLEELHLARLDDLNAGLATLRAADMTNRKTWEANHNATPISALINELRKGRRTLIERIVAWDPARLETSAVHPRLGVPMRLVDLAYFIAEHDDYHLARVDELLKMFRAESGAGSTDQSPL